MEGNERSNKEHVEPINPSFTILDNRLESLESISTSVPSCRNPNIGFATKCEVQGIMRLRVCLGVKHTFTNGGKVEGMKPNDSQVHSHFGSYTRARVVNVQNLG